MAATVSAAMERLRVLLSVNERRVSELLRGALCDRGHDVVLSSATDSPRDLLRLDAMIVDADRAPGAVSAALAERGHDQPLVYAYLVEPSLGRASELADAGVSGFLTAESSAERLFAQLLSIEARARDRVLARQRERKAAEALLYNRANSDALLNALPDLMFRISRTGEYLDYRAERPSELLVPENEIIGSTVYDAFPQQVADELLEVIRRALSTMDVELWECTVQTERGERTYEARIVACSPDEVICLVRDMTERKQLAAQLAMADRLSALGTLIAGMAHEINNPLTYVLIGIDAVSRELKKHDPQQPIGDRLTLILQRLGEAFDGAQRVRRIVGELKGFARNDHEAKDSVDVRRILDAVCAMVHDEVYARGELTREYGAIPLVTCNEDLLTQVFLHVLLNATHALDASERDTNLIRVRTLTDGEGRAVVQISDTGHGISPADLDRIFDPFFTTKPLGVGTGLGLWMSQTILARYGGGITVDSKQSDGTIVTVELPAADVSSPEEIWEPGALSPGARVLVVDPDGYAARELSTFEITHVATGGEAARRLSSEESFDIVLCDLLLPDGTGMDLYEKVRLATPGKEERFVFMTGDTFTPQIRAFLSRVPNVCVSKPIRSAALEDVLRRRDRD